MSVRRKTTNRLSLVRSCHACRKTILTTADTPWVRQITNVNGKGQKTCYFCCESCKQSSYKHLFDGMARQRRIEREKSRDVKEKNRRYYIAHQEQVRARARERYWSDRESGLLDLEYQRKKKRLLEVSP